LKDKEKIVASDSAANQKNSSAKTRCLEVRKKSADAAAVNGEA